MFNLTKKGRYALFETLSGAASQLPTGLVYLFVCLKALGGAFGVGAVTQYVAAITAFSAGLSGAIAGAADTFMSKNKARTMDAKLAKMTKWVAIVFIILTFVMNLI